MLILVFSKASLKVHVRARQEQIASGVPLFSCLHTWHVHRQEGVGRRVLYHVSRELHEEFGLPLGFNEAMCFGCCFRLFCFLCFPKVIIWLNKSFLTPTQYNQTDLNPNSFFSAAYLINSNLPLYLGNSLPLNCMTN